jgi:CheY-like chemotaxis protein
MPARARKPLMADPTPVVSVLVIDDNMDAADSLARYLRVGGGFDVRVAYDGQTGLRSPVQQPPDAIVCDIGLPKLDGLQFARELVASLPRKPLLIAVTGYGAAPLRRRKRWRPGSITTSSSPPTRLSSSG